MLRRKTRVLVTHQLHLLPSLDRVAMVEAGSVVRCDTHERLAASGVSFASLIHVEASASGGGGGGEEEAPPDEAEAWEYLATAVRDAAGGGPAGAAGVPGGGSGGGDGGQASAAGKVTEDEERCAARRVRQCEWQCWQCSRRYRGQVGVAVYKAYLSRMGSCGWVAFILVLQLVMQGAETGADVWLAVWTGHLADAGTGYGLSDGAYLSVYAALAVGVRAGARGGGRLRRQAKARARAGDGDCDRAELPVVPCDVQRREAAARADAELRAARDDGLL